MLAFMSYYINTGGANRKYPSIDFYLDFSTTFTLIYSTSAVILFYTFCHVASQNLDLMKRKIEELTVQKPAAVVHRYINQLKEFYFRNSQFIHQINDSFGFILVFEIPNSFFQVIFEVIVMVLGFKTPEPWYFYTSSIALFFMYLTNIIIVISISDKMIKEVIIYGFQLKRYECCLVLYHIETGIVPCVETHPTVALLPYRRA